MGGTGGGSNGGDGGGGDGGAGGDCGGGHAYMHHAHGKRGSRDSVTGGGLWKTAVVRAVSQAGASGRTTAS
jgi:hypothetical protein